MTEYVAIPNEYYDVMGEKGFSNHYAFNSFMLYPEGYEVTSYHFCIEQFK